MTDDPSKREQDSTPRPGGLRRREAWLWVLAVGLFLAGLVRWIAGGPRVELEGLELPWRPPEVEASLRKVESLPPGELAGWNVLLVTLDTTRPDRLGCYGNDAIGTPHLDGLAADGVIFVDALATSPTTLPSHASILTGLLPHRHGARANGLFPLAEDHATLAELLAAGGYETAAFVSSFVLDARFGLSQGFAVYDDDLETEAGSRVAPGERGVRPAERRGDRTTDRALAWLRRSRPPFLLWVHYYDPHADYEPPAAWAERAANPYDGEIAFVDAQLGRLLTALDTQGLADRTLVLVVADHGEALGDHGELTHGLLLHEATLRVPLLMRAGASWRGLRVDRPVSQVDLAPTVLSLLGIPVPPGLDGLDLTREPSPQARALVAESVQGLVEYGWAPLATLRAGTRKYIHGPRPELYDLAADPLELHDRAAAERQATATLRSRLEAAYAGDLDAALSPEPPAELDPDTAARLEALGYLAAGSPPSPPDGRPDPKTMLPVLTRVQEIFYGEAPLRGADAAAADLQAIATRQPDFAPTFRYLAHLHRTRGDLVRSERAARRALELSPGSTPLVGLLAGILLQQGRIDEATAALEGLLERHPRYFEGHLQLGLIRLGVGDAAAASDHLLRAFEIDPGQEAVLEPLVQAMSAAGRHDELRAALEAVLAARPEDTPIRRALEALPGADA